MEDKPVIDMETAQKELLKRLDRFIGVQKTGYVLDQIKQVILEFCNEVSIDPHDLPLTIEDTRGKNKKVGKKRKTIEENFEETIKTYQTLVKQSPLNYLLDLAAAYQHYSDYLKEQGLPASARSNAREALLAAKGYVTLQDLALNGKNE